MPYLKCTNKVLNRAKLNKAFLKKPEKATATLGNWCVSVFQVESRNVFVYMSEKTLLSFIMMEGQRIDAQRLSTAFIGGLCQLLEMEGVNVNDITRVADEYSEGSYSGVDDLSVTGILTSIGKDYQLIIESEGGLERCNIANIIHYVNTLPRKQLNFESPLSFSISALKIVVTQ